MTIITYGGGEILFHLFTGIKMIFNSGFIKTLAFLMASISAVYTIFSSYFSLNADGLTKRFLLPTIVLVILCFSIKSTVIIEDTLPLSSGGINWLSREAFDGNNKNVSRQLHPSRTVDGIPFFIAFLSQSISTIGHKLTVAVENIFHTVDDEKYSKTGMIFGAETALDMNEIVIQDGNLDNNLRTFCRTCMLYDLALNLYTIKDLKNETNLLGLLKRRTAKSRYMNYQSDEVGESELVSCQEAINRISEKLKKGGSEVAHQQKKQIFRNLPVAYQALTKISGDSQKVVQQMLMMSVVNEEMASEAFASKRAALQQKSYWKTIGSIADGLIVTTRGVIEALIYAALIFVIPLMFLPAGLKYLQTWVWLLVWIQLWPPFYAILDYVSLITARGQAEGLFNEALASNCCLNIYNTVGLSNVYSNISAYAKSMKILIPPISYAILQGGAGSFVHLTSSMMGASQQATASASSDEVSGNYNFSNASMNTKSFANATYGQQNYNPSFSSGYIKQDSIEGTTLYSTGDSTMNENFSRFSFSVSEDSAVQSSLTSNLMNSRSAHEASTMSLSETISNSGRSTMDFTQHLANDTSYNLTESGGESFDVSKSAQICESTVENFAKDHSISDQCAWEVFTSIGAGIPFTEASAGISTRHGLITTDTWNEAMSVSNNKEFREAYSNVENFAHQYAHNKTDSEGSRLANSVTHSVDNMRSSFEQYSTTFDEMNQASQTASYYNSLSYTERKDLSQDLLDYAVEEKGYSINQFKGLIHERDSVELGELISSFGSTRTPEMNTLNDYESPDSFYSSKTENIFSNDTIQSSLDENSISHNLSTSIKEQVNENISNQQDQKEKITEIQEQIRETKKIFENKEVNKHLEERRELDVDTLWNHSFDDDLIPIGRFY